MPNVKRPSCPSCGSTKQVSAIGVGGDMFYCGRCNMAFDNDPNEGGDHSDHNPAARLERAERGRQQGTRR